MVKDLKGKKFSKLKVIERGKNTEAGKARWICLCECGRRKEVIGSKLLNGHTKSCGCIVKKHGMFGTKTYSVWAGMKARCLDKKAASYKFYGGRGIKVCDRWLKFENFYADMGEVPAGLTLDRVDSGGNYKKGNCRWASWNTQANNKRNNIFVSINGVQTTFKEFARTFGLNYNVLHNRIFRDKRSLKDALKN